MTFEWKGILCCKNPFDFALYSTLIWRQKPGTIIEIGTYHGGSALWLADLTASYGLQTKILSIDIDRFSEFSDPRIEFRQGDATRLAKVIPETEMRELPRPLLVIEDANHQYETTMAVLRYLDPWMAPGEYIAVEDGIVDPFAVQDRYNGGPNTAISDFLSETIATRSTHPIVTISART